MVRSPVSQAKLKSRIRDKLLETAVIHDRPWKIGSNGSELPNSISFHSITACWSVEI